MDLLLQLVSYFLYSPTYIKGDVDVANMQVVLFTCMANMLPGSSSIPIALIVFMLMKAHNKKTSFAELLILIRTSRDNSYTMRPLNLH